LDPFLTFHSIFTAMHAPRGVIYVIYVIYSATTIIGC